MQGRGQIRRWWGGRIAGMLLLASSAPGSAETPGASRASCSQALAARSTPAGGAGLASGVLQVRGGAVSWVGGQLATVFVPGEAEGLLADSGILTDWTTRTDLRFKEIGPADRWGRQAFMLEGNETVLEAELVSGGWAIVRPGTAPAACVRWLLALEEEARRAGRGLWSSPGSVLLSAEDIQGVLAREGHFVLVDGRVLGLGETKTRVYLNFGTVRSQDFTVSIQKRNLRKVEASGMRWTSWEGRHIRVRGVVVQAGGPLIEVSSPDDVERLD